MFFRGGFEGGRSLLAAAHQSAPHAGCVHAAFSVARLHAAPPLCVRAQVVKGPRFAAHLEESEEKKKRIPRKRKRIEGRAALGES